MDPYLRGVTVLAVDLVGTLVEQGSRAFFQSASKHLGRKGYDVPLEKFRSLFRRRCREYTMGNYENDREFYPALLADLSRAEWDPSFEGLTDMLIECSPAFADAPPFLEQASASYQLVLSTNYVKEWAERILISHRWERYFKACVVSSDCRARKPSRRFFRELLKVSGVRSPSQVPVVGDSMVNDMYGATSLGLKALLLDRRGANRKREFLPAIPAVSSLGDFANFLNSERDDQAKQFVAEC